MRNVMLGLTILRCHRRFEPQSLATEYVKKYAGMGWHKYVEKRQFYTELAFRVLNVIGGVYSLPIIDCSQWMA